MRLNPGRGHLQLVSFSWKYKFVMEVFSQLMLELFRTIGSVFRSKSGRKLTIFSVILFLVIVGIVFTNVYMQRREVFLKVSDEGLNVIPDIIADRREELETQGAVYEEDMVKRAELGLKNYEQNPLPEVQVLEHIKSGVNADSVSILDENRQVLVTTGPVSQEEVFKASIEKLEPRTFYLERHHVLAEDGEETGKNGGKGFVLIPVSENGKQSLVFEFSCDGLMQLYDALEDWPSILEHLLYGEAVAFAKTGDRVTGYPLDSFTEVQRNTILKKANHIFNDKNKYLSEKNGKLVTLMDTLCVVKMIHFSEMDTDVMVVIPLKAVFGNGFYITLGISAIIGCGIILIQFYVFYHIAQEKKQKGKKTISPEMLRGIKWPGILVLLVVTVVFSYMLLLLENRTDAIYIARSKLANVQHEIAERKSLENTIRNNMVNVYREYAKTLADFLKEHPESQTHEGLKELNGIARTEYLMLFDRDGKEIIASNNYIGFTVEKNLNEKVQSVLMGYPDAVAGPEPDPFTGKMQLSAAVLMTDSEGKADGFLLAVYNAAELKEKLDRTNFEAAVNGFTVQKGHVVAAIRDEDGIFVAHSDPVMIGQKASDFLTEVKPGSDFEGSVLYTWTRMSVCAKEIDGKTLLFMIQENKVSNVEGRAVWIGMIVLLIMAFVYYPIASKLILQTESEMRRDLAIPTVKPKMIFYDGYIVFLTGFVLVTILLSYCGIWTPFEYVLKGGWTTGVHLYSIWACVFIITAALFFDYLCRRLLDHVEKRQNIKVKTTIRIFKSFIEYGGTIVVFFTVLNMFGVNTTTMLASAGVISIAVGMGAQSMAADLLAGIFMLFDGTVCVGDEVNVNGVVGQVTNMGIRTMEITDNDGNTVVFNNSKVTGARNMSRRNDKLEAKKDEKHK